VKNEHVFSLMRIDNYIKLQEQQSSQEILSSFSFGGFVKASQNNDKEYTDLYKKFIKVTNVKNSKDQI
jgi:alpha/beta superfamily hydrolase